MLDQEMLYRTAMVEVKGSSWGMLRTTTRAIFPSRIRISRSKIVTQM